jgi:hypothetical protein
MSSEILVVLILTAVAVLFIFWVRSKSQPGGEPERTDDNVNQEGSANR